MFKRTIFSMGAVAIALGFSTYASAAVDDLCVPQARGVPGPQNKFPEWWVPGAPGKEQRWTGATSRTGNPGVSATPSMVDVRSVWDADSRRMFLHLSVKGDPQINPAQDMVALALTDAAGAPLVYLDVRPMLGCAAGDTTDPADLAPGCLSGEAVSGGSPTNPVVRYSAGTPGSGWGSTVVANPTSGGASEIVDEHHWVQVTPAEGGLFDWDFKVSLELPVDAGTGQVDPDVRLYGTSFVAFKSGPGVADPVVTLEFPMLCNPEGVAGASCEMDHGSAGPSLPDAVPDTTTRWPAIQTGTAGDCEGIEVIRGLVGSDKDIVAGVVPGTAIPYPLPGHTIAASTGSRLRAGFHNNTATALGTGSVQAEFRVANWGLTYANWDAATWDLVKTANLGGSVDSGNYAGAAGQGAIETDPYIAGAVPTNDHQCVHVKLSATPGSGDTLKFRADSVYRNMQFVNASVVRRPADVNLVGRALGPGQSEHPVYLVVRTHNMPSPAMCEELKGDLDGCFSVDLANDPTTALARVPRYTVHGFVDSGRRVNLPDAPQTPILSPFSSYGYYVRHEGKIDGWEHQLDGATPLAPYDSVYRLDVSEGHIANVVDTIRVVDDQTPSCTQVTLPMPGPGIPSPGGVVAEDEGPTPIGPSGAKAPLGCEPAEVRPQCEPGECAAHDRCNYIEGSEYTYQPPPSDDPPETQPGTICCLNTKETNEQKVRGAGGASCLFIMMWGLRRRRRGKS